MINSRGVPRVLEFNVRMGDPETQPILFRLDSDLLDLLEAAVDGQLDRVQTQWNPQPSLGVVMAAGGYPGAIRKGEDRKSVVSGKSVTARVDPGGRRTLKKKTNYELINHNNTH